MEGGVLHRVKREEELFGRRNVRVGICPGGGYIQGECPDSSVVPLMLL